MNISEFVHVLRRQLILVFAAALIGLSVGALSSMLTAARYNASTDVYVGVQVRPDAGAWERNQARSYVQQVLESYRSIITSSLVLQPVVDEMHLKSAKAVASTLSTSVRLRSAVITITVTHADPGTAAQVANSVATSFANVITNTVEPPTDGAPYLVRVLQIEQARVPTSPASPNMRNSLFLGGLIGLSLGITAALLRATLDPRIRTAHDVEDTLDVPLIGEIAFHPEASERPLIVAANPGDPRSEAFRALRTNLDFLFTQGRTGTFVVTSSGPGEGKSTTAANLALSFAEAGRRVALVDGDLRLPRVADYFGIEGSVGLSDVLIGRVRVNDVLQRWGPRALFLLPSGSVPPNPAELLGSDGMQKLLDDMASAFDVIIIDAPPILLVTDAAAVGRNVTGVIMVAASDIATKPRLRSAAATIDAAGASILGSVVTMIPMKGADKVPYGGYINVAASG